MVWRNRIIGHGVKRASEFTFHPLNWRKHPDAQREALAASLREVGWVATVIENVRTGHLIDGHERIQQALDAGDLKVPYIQVDLSEEEENLVLATLDPISAMAEMEMERFSALLEQVQSDEEALNNLLENLLEAQREELPPPPPDLPTGQVFSEEEVIEAAFAWFRSRGFPYPKLPRHVCMQEINRLAETEAKELLRTSVAYRVADTYHPHRFHTSAVGMKSPFEAFSDDKLFRAALQKTLKYGGRLTESMPSKLSIVSGVQAASNFRPGFACYLYRKFCRPGDTVLDLSMGYGGRLVGFIASGIAGLYIGTDPCKPTYEGNVRLAEDLGFADKVELYNLPAEDIPAEKLQGRCDFAFTSPPYFAKEHYSDEDTQSWVRYPTGEAWYQGFLEPFLRLQFAALKPGAYAVLNIADVQIRGEVYPLVDWTLEAAAQAGFTYEGTEFYELTNRMGAGMDDEVTAEPVLIFRKGIDHE